MAGRALVTAAGVAIFAVAASSSETVAAPKRHQEVQYYTITLTNGTVARGPRLKAKPQTNTGARPYQGFVSRFSAGQRENFNEGMRPTLLLQRLSVPRSPN